MNYDNEYLRNIIKEKGIYKVVESIDENFVEDKELKIIIRTIKHSMLQLVKSLEETDKKQKIQK